MPKVKTNRQQAFTGSLKPGRNICTCPCAHCRDEMSRVRAAATSTKGCPHIGAQSSLLFCTLSSTLPICGSSTKLSSRLGDSNICMSQVGVNRSFKKQKKKKKKQPPPTLPGAGEQLRLPSTYISTGWACLTWQSTCDSSA